MSSSTASGSQHNSNPTPNQVLAAAEAIGYYLRDQTYAVVGAAACLLLGSERVTKDVNIVVPQGTIKDIRKILKNQPAYFDVEERTLHTHYKSDPMVEVEILSPPFLFREAFNASTPVVVIGSTKVLKPTLILNSKCNSILQRETEEKKRSDAADIQFCLSWCYSNNCFLTAEEVPRSDTEFVRWFTSLYGGEDGWTNVGYNFETGQRI